MKQKSIFNRFSMLPHGLRYKLLIAFSLMSIIPLLLISYLVNTFILLDKTASLAHVSIVVLFALLIAWLGLLLAKNIIERVIDVALESKIIIEGNYERKIYVDTGDEIGQIGEAVNFLTKKIKDNIIDLKDYQNTMKEINLEVQKRVTVLSNILQIGELITAGVNVNDILDVAITKVAQLYEGGFAVLYFSEKPDEPFRMRLAHNISDKKLWDSAIKESKGVIGKALRGKRRIVWDASSKFSANYQEAKLKYKCENMIALSTPVSTNKKLLLVTGNTIKNFTYTNDDLEIVKVFMEQISITIENDILISRAKKLEIKDERTGLFNREYTLRRLGEEVQRSFVSHRPCSFILTDIDDFVEYGNAKGEAEAEIAMREIVGIMHKFSGILGKTGRMGKNRFALVIPEINKRNAMALAEKIRKAVEDLRLLRGKDKNLTVSCGVSENPLDGATPESIIKKAEEALAKAKKGGKNKTEAAGA